MRLLPIIIVTVLVMASNAVATDTSRELQSAVHKLTVWLGQDSRADSWRRLLDLNVLEAQAAKGPRADAVKLSQIYNRFCAHNYVMHIPQFNDTKTAIQHHINSLSGLQNTDLTEAIAAAKDNYQPVSIAQLERRRDEAVHELKNLEDYYLSNVAQEERAELFSTLQFDEMRLFLKDLSFELPPDISVGKLNDRLKLLKAQINSVEQKLDELPELEDPDVESPETDESPAGVDGESDSPDNSSPSLEAENPTEDTRAELSDELERLNQDLKELEALHATVLAGDRERQRTRAQVWRQIGKFNRGIVDTSQIRNDYYFAAFQHSFYKFALLYFYGTDDNLQSKFDEKHDILAREFDKLQTNSERDAAATVGNIIGWLDAAEQSAELCRLIELKHSLPNVTFSVTRSFINRLGSRPIQENRPVNELIMGRKIQGCATVNGNVNIDLLEDPNQASLNLHLLGNIHSETHTRQGRITGFAGADVHIEGRQPIAVSIGGLLVGLPYGSASVNSNFHGVDSRLRIIQKIARKQYRRDKAESERISGRRIESQFLSQFSEQTAIAVAQGKQRMADVRSEIEGLGGYFPELYLRTTYDRLWAYGNKTVFKLAHSGRVSNLAATSHSTGSSVNADVAIQLHESILSNFADEIFNSRTFTNDELAEEAEKITSEVPEGLATNDDEEGWSITFSDARPIRFEFEDNRMAVTISGRRFSQGENRIQAGLKIRIPFIIERGDDVLKLIRDGEAEITYMDPDRINAKIVAFKSFLETKLNSFEKRESARPGFVLPNNLIPIDRVERLKDFQLGRELQLVELRMQEGWLYVGWNHAAPGTLFSHVTDTPGIWDKVNPAQGVGSIRDPDLPSTSVSQASAQR